MVYINDSDISWSLSDADLAEAERVSTLPTITPLDHVDPYPEEGALIAEERAALRNLYNFG